MRTLITGASSGLGAEMARQFAALGHDLVLTARRTDRLMALRDEILKGHPTRQVDIAALDVRTTMPFRRAFATTTHSTASSSTRASAPESRSAPTTEKTTGRSP